MGSKELYLCTGTLGWWGVKHGKDVYRWQMSQVKCFCHMLCSCFPMERAINTQASHFFHVMAPAGTCRPCLNQSNAKLLHWNKQCGKSKSSGNTIAMCNHFTAYLYSGVRCVNLWHLLHISPLTKWQCSTTFTRNIVYQTMGNRPTETNLSLWSMASNYAHVLCHLLTASHNGTETIKEENVSFLIRNAC